MLVLYSYFFLVELNPSLKVSKILRLSIGMFPRFSKVSKFWARWQESKISPIIMELWSMTSSFIPTVKICAKLSKSMNKVIMGLRAFAYCSSWQVERLLKNGLNFVMRLSDFPLWHSLSQSWNEVDRSLRVVGLELREDSQPLPSIPSEWR